MQSKTNVSENPLGKANPLSRLFFVWIFPLLRKGCRKELEPSDLYTVLPEDQSDHLGDQLNHYWQMEVNGGGKPSLLLALWKMSWPALVPVLILNILNQCVVLVTQPIVLRKVILHFNNHMKANETATNYTSSYDDDTYLGGRNFCLFSVFAENEGFLYASALCLIVFLNTLMNHPCVWLVMRLAMRLRSATSALVYRKSLRLSQTSKRQTSSGQIINLLSNDCDRFNTTIHFLVSAPIQMPIFMCLLYSEVGHACWVVLGVILLLVPVQYCLAKYSAKFLRNIVEITDKRCGLMNEIISGIRVIKEYAWETPFTSLVDQVRMQETCALRKRALLRGLQYAISFFGQPVVLYLTFLFIVVKGERLSPEQVFFTKTCVHTLLQTATVLTPSAVVGLNETLVAVKRIQTFLLLEEQQEKVKPYLLNSRIITPLQKNGGLDNKSYSENEFCQVRKNNIKMKRVRMESACARWMPEGKQTLDKVTFSLEGDKLVMVVGPVGSSKSSLLHALLHELPLSVGNVSVEGTLSYASQQPWIFADTLRQNILFGLPYEESRYNDILEACALQEDLRNLPHGDWTLVGERGVALSGGQKARVNLARALYRRAEIYLLDDPLSAVDARVSRHIFEKCIGEHLQGTLRIVVTHQLQYLPQADHILVLNEGRILAQGSFQDLMQAGIFNLTASTGEERKNTFVDSEENSNLVEKVNKKKPEEHKEMKVNGSVTAQTYRDYFLLGHSVPRFLVIMLAFLLTQVCSSGSDIWLRDWTDAERRMIKKNATNYTSTYDDDDDDTFLGLSSNFLEYSGFVGAVTIFSLWRGLGFYRYCIGTSVAVHEVMFRGIVRAPIKFFDDNPSGRIMSRFTSDVATVDERLPAALIETITVFLQVIGTIGVVIYSNYYMSVPATILLVLLYFIRGPFVKNTRNLKRNESMAKSPLSTHVSTTLEGLTSIRASGAQAELIKQFEGLLDAHASSWLLYIGANRCFGIWLELVCDTFLVFTVFSFLLYSGSEGGSSMGLAISSLLTMMGSFQRGMRQSAETENYMTSVERVLEYSKLEPEAELESNDIQKLPNSWPEFGEIEFKKNFLCYNKKNVLKDISFKIRPSEKIGIVGRTGAGKTSIITALFRLAETQGEIRIDNVCIQNIGLHDLRKSISIIPQEPWLFSGSVRYNLDPFSQFPDDQLWQVIEEVGLNEHVPSLDYRVSGGGSNFSMGQRQLVCLARVMLRKNRILVMDEATANVDPRTDNLIQQTIRSKFAECTVITIAHRLESIIDCDRILVLENGQLIEFDHPFRLLQREEGIFTKLVRQTGSDTSAKLREMAAFAFSSSKFAKKT